MEDGWKKWQPGRQSSRMRRTYEQRGDLHEETRKEEEREWKLKTLQKLWEEAGEKQQSELQTMKSYGTQMSSTAIEIFHFLAMEIPFSGSWSVEREVCLFQSHSTSGGVFLNSNLCEGKKSHFGTTMKLPMGNICLGNLIIQTILSSRKPVSQPDRESWQAFHFSFELLWGTSDC